MARAIIQGTEAIGLPLLTREDWWRHEKALQELRQLMEEREKHAERLERFRSTYWRWIGLLIAIASAELGVILTLLTLLSQ